MATVLRATHLGICVKDIEASLRFYRDLLGFRELSELEIEGEPTDTLLRIPGAQLRALYLERDGLRIELLDFGSPGVLGEGAPRAMNARGLTHLSLRIADLDDMLTHLRACGVRVLEETVIRFPEWDSGAAFVLDPDGVLIELVQSPGDPAVPPGAPREDGEPG